MASPSWPSWRRSSGPPSHPDQCSPRAQRRPSSSHPRRRWCPRWWSRTRRRPSHRRGGPAGSLSHQSAGMVTGDGRLVLSGGQTGGSVRSVRTHRRSDRCGPWRANGSGPRWRRPKRPAGLGRAPTRRSPTPKDREQFGRVVGSFQAIEHHCANMLVDCQRAATLHLGTLSAWELRVLNAPNYRLRGGTFRVFAKLNSPKTVKSEATATRPSPALPAAPSAPPATKLSPRHASA